RIALDDCDRTCATIALGTAFLRAGQSVEPQPFEQSHVRRNRIDANFATIQPKLQHPAHLARRFCSILRNERERISSSESPVASASASVIAPQAMPRRKKFSNPCPVAASSKTSPKSEASAAFSTNVFSRFDALWRP